MPSAKRLPRLRAAIPLAVIFACALTAVRSHAQTVASQTSEQTKSSVRPWVVKITPVYRGDLERIEIRYRHHARPFVLRSGSTEQVEARPTIRIASMGTEAWLGLDTDLVWEGRCSLTGQWLAVDVDRSHQGPSTPNLRYDFRARRLTIAGGTREVKIDLSDGTVEGDAKLLGLQEDAHENLRDYFLSNPDGPLRVVVSDRPGCSGAVWIFDDMSSVAVGPADQAWFSPSNATTRPSFSKFQAKHTPAGSSRPADQATSSSLPLLRPPVPRPSTSRQEPRRPLSFGCESFKPVESIEAPPDRPAPFTSWPGKDLPAAVRCRPGQPGPADRTIESLSNRWHERVDWLDRVIQAAGPGQDDLKPNPVASKAVLACARTIAKACGFENERLDMPASSTAKNTPFPQLVAHLSRRLSQLESQVDQTVGQARRAARTERSLTRSGGGLVEAERDYRPIAMGHGLADEAVCLLMDLAVSDAPLPDRRQAATMLARRVLERARSELLTRLWNSGRILTTDLIPSGPDRPWGQSVLFAMKQSGLSIDPGASGERALSVLASAIYDDDLAARHFRRHLFRRFPDRMSVTPVGVGELVEELAVGGVAAPRGVEQLLAMCRGVRQERQSAASQAGVKFRAARRLVARAETLVQRIVTQRSSGLAAARKVSSARERAFPKQEKHVLELIKWVCDTYADQIFGRTDLSDVQRKRLIMSTAAWWTRQWEMDLCWVAVDFEIDVKRQGRLYAWRIRDLRVALLDSPDPQAVVEERLASTTPPRAFPLGPIKLVSGKSIRPRTLVELDAVDPELEITRATHVSRPRPTTRKVPVVIAKDRIDPRIIMPQAVSAAPRLVDLEPHAPNPTARPQTVPQLPEAELPEAEHAAAVLPAEVGPPLPQGEAREPVRLVEPEPLVLGEELSVPLMLGSDRQAEARHMEVRAGQLVRIMGMARLPRSPGRTVRVHVDLFADEPASKDLPVRTSPQAVKHGRAETVDLPSGRWLRRTIQWQAATDDSVSFIVGFHAPAPSSKAETLTLTISCETNEADGAKPLADQTYVLYLLGKSDRTGLMASASGS